MAAALDISGLHYRYADGTHALRGLSASVGEAETVGIVGPNGAGKTTLCLVLAGFLEAREGSVHFFGTPLDPRNLARIRAEVGFSFHDPDDQLFMPTVLEDVCFGLLSAGRAPEQAVQQAHAALAELGIDHLAQRPPGHLSAGQKRLATFAGVLVMKPRMLVLDEPTAFLDPHARRQVLGHLRAATVPKVIITHDLEMVLEICDRVIVLFEGRTAASGAPADVLRDGDLMRAHRLEVPYSLRPGILRSGT